MDAQNRNLDHGGNKSLPAAHPRRSRLRVSAAILLLGVLLGAIAAVIGQALISSSSGSAEAATSATESEAPLQLAPRIVDPDFRQGEGDIVEPFGPPSAPLTSSERSSDLDPSLLEVSGPVSITEEDGAVVENLIISNPDGPCIKVEGSTNITIRNSIIGPCGGRRAIHIDASSDIEIRDSLIQDSVSGVYAHQSSGIRVLNNEFKDAGRNYIQFDKVNGGDNRVNNNWGENKLGNSNAEDMINLYQSNGTASQPIQVFDNRFQNGGPSLSGSGIMTGDSGGSYQHIRGNILVNPGQVGIGISGGNNIIVEQNRVYSDRQDWSNVGIYVWNWNSKDPSCHSHTVRNNIVNWTKSDNNKNGFFDGDNCGDVAGVDQNNWNANITASIY